MNQGRAARCVMHAHRHGVLATHSKKFKGYPFGSVVPYVLDDGACPVILISALAEHTRNIQADARVSLLVQEHAVDVQAGARLTLLGDATAAKDDAGDLRKRYLSYFPDAARLFEMADFDLFRIVPKALRFIGGFGEIHWIDAAEYAPPANTIGAGDASGKQLNDLHADPVRLYCGRLLNQPITDAMAIGLDCDGLDVRAGNQLVRIEFDHTVMTMTEASAALLDTVQRAHKP